MPSFQAEVIPLCLHIAIYGVLLKDLISVNVQSSKCRGEMGSDTYLCIFIAVDLPVCYSCHFCFMYWTAENCLQTCSFHTCSSQGTLPILRTSFIYCSDWPNKSEFECFGPHDRRKRRSYPYMFLLYLRHLFFLTLILLQADTGYARIHPSTVWNGWDIYKLTDSIYKMRMLTVP